MVNGKQHSVWFIPTGMKGLPQNVLLNFRLEFPKSVLTIYLPSGISDIFGQMVSTPCALLFFKPLILLTSSSMVMLSVLMQRGSCIMEAVGFIVTLGG